jgi:hypothetical protein
MFSLTSSDYSTSGPILLRISGVSLSGDDPNLSGSFLPVRHPSWSSHRPVHFSGLFVSENATSN